MKKEFKNRLSEIIKTENHNNKSFADEIDSSENAISQYVNGHKQLPLLLTGAASTRSYIKLKRTFSS